jgi:hypothetical protein
MIGALLSNINLIRAGTCSKRSAKPSWRLRRRFLVQLRDRSSNLTISALLSGPDRENLPMKQIDRWWQSFRETKFRHDCVNRGDGA